MIGTELSFNQRYQWSKSAVWDNVLKKFKHSEVCTYSQRLDMKSCMMSVYRCKYWSTLIHQISLRCPLLGCTVRVKGQLEADPIWPNHELSNIDKAYLILHYPPAPNSPSSKSLHAKGWDLEKALDTAEVPKGSKLRDSILEATSPSDIRFAFISWNQDNNRRCMSWWKRGAK